MTGIRDPGSGLCSINPLTNPHSLHASASFVSIFFSDFPLIFHSLSGLGWSSGWGSGWVSGNFIVFSPCWPSALGKNKLCQLRFRSIGFKSTPTQRGLHFTEIAPRNCFKLPLEKHKNYARDHNDPESRLWTIDKSPIGAGIICFCHRFVLRENRYNHGGEVAIIAGL